MHPHSLVGEGGCKEKLNDLESESDIFPQDEGKVGESDSPPEYEGMGMLNMYWPGQNLTFYREFMERLRNHLSLWEIIWAAESASGPVQF